MLTRWFFSQTYRDAELGHIMPVCRAYGHHWHIPQHPIQEGGWTLVQMACGQHQIEAAKQDSRVLVLPLLFDRTPLPDPVIYTYTPMGAKPGMDLASLLSVLTEVEPRFALALR